MKLLLLALLSLNAGYVDAAGFLALHGLFTTHVTGNFVTLGAALAFGTSGILAKLLALPTFCAVIVIARIAGIAIERRGWPALHIMFLVQALLLAAGGWAMWRFGPFPDGDAPTALWVGALLVSAMAIQNAVHRVRLTSFPPSTVMTGTTTQVMIDVTDLMRGVGPEKRAAAKKRLAPMALSLATFAAGCAAGAIAYTFYKELCFAAPPLVALATLAAASSAGPTASV